MTLRLFPVLTHLILHVKDRYPSPLPDNFLGGSAPRLWAISLRNVAFPALQRFLL